MDRITGANVAYLYDRGINTKNAVLEGNFYASYGTKIRFKNRVGTIMGRDHYNSRYPIGLNSLVAEVDLQFQNLDDGEAAIVMKTLHSKIDEDGENAGYVNLGTADNTAVGTGDFTGVFFNISNATGNYIYNDLSGLYVEDFEDIHKENGLHDITTKLVGNAHSPFIRWSGLYPYSADISGWTTGQSYQENDIVYLAWGGHAPQDRFFYCTAAHTSSLSSLPDTTNSPYWTKSFKWQPDFAANISQTQAGEVDAFKEGLVNRIKINRNNQTLDLDLSFQNRSDREARAILHYLENRMGHKKFNFTLSGIYRSKKMWTAPTWEHEMIHKDVNNISVSIKEEVRIAPPSGFLNSGVLAYVPYHSETSTYVTHVENVGGKVRPQEIRALDIFYDSINRVPSGGAGTIKSMIRHAWIPLCSGTGGIQIAAVYNEGFSGMTSLGTHFGLDFYSPESGYKFATNGGIYNGVVEQSNTRFPLSVYVIEDNAADTAYGLQGCDSAGNEYLIEKTATTTIRGRQSSSTTVTYSPATITGLFSMIQSGTNLHMFQGTVSKASTTLGANTTSFGYKFVYGAIGTNSAATPSYINPCSSRIGAMFVFESGMKDQHFIGLANAVQTLMNTVRI